MQSNKIATPEYILPDDQDTFTVKGHTFRKGTAKAAVDNAKLFMAKDSDKKTKENAHKALEELMPALVLLDFFDVFEWKDKTLKQMAQETMKGLGG